MNRQIIFIIFNKNKINKIECVIFNQRNLFMGRKAILRKRKPITNKVVIWLNDLLIAVQSENLEVLTIDDMARLAKISKSTFYEYFESKEDVLLAACKIRVDYITNKLLLLNKQKPTTIKLYESLVEIFAEGTVGISISYIQSIKKNYTNSWLLIDGLIETFLKLLKEQYEIGISSGNYNTISIELLIQIDKLFVLQLVTNPILFSDKKYTLSKLVKDYLNLRLYGLLKR